MTYNLAPITKVAYNLKSKSQKEIIERLSLNYGIEFIPADDVSDEEDLPLLRVTKNNLVLEHGRETLFFHPSMALLRMINIKRGEGDRFLEAAGLSPGDVFLDATMGLASDALIASWAVGERGKVLALEASPLVFMLVQEGLKDLMALKKMPGKSSVKQEAWLELAKACSRIEARCLDHQITLERLPESSVDVIYFDPMFRQTILSSSSMRPLKGWSYAEPLRPKTIDEACRAARKRVVLKERKNSGEFQRLGFEPRPGGKYSSVDFGTIDLTKVKGGKICSP